MNNGFSWDRTLPIEQEQIQQEPVQPFSWENTRNIGQREVTHPLDIQKQMSREQFMALPFEERAELSRQLGEQAQEEIGESIVSGAVPGFNRLAEQAREKGILPEKSISENQAVIPRLIGQAIPFGAAFKGAGKLLSFMKLNPAIAPYIEAGLAAAGFEAARKPLEEGEFASLGELTTHAGLGAGSVGAGKLIGKGINKIREQFGPQSKEITESLLKISPEEISQTPFETAEEALGVLKESTKVSNPEVKKSFLQEILEKPKGKSAEPLTGRVTKQNSHRIGLEIPTTKAPTTFEENVLKGFPVEVENSTKAGKSLAGKVQEADEKVYKEVNNLYAKSREANKNIVGAHPDLVSEMENIVNNINKIPDPSPIQIKLKRSAQRLEKRLAKRNEEGTIEVYNDISNQDLIEQMQSWRQLIDYDFAHGDPHNIFKPAIKAIENAVTDAAEIVGGEAAQLNRTAKNAYREWTELFNEGDIKKFRKGGNLNFSQNFKNSVNIDDINKLRPILDKTEEGKAILEGMQRELVDKELAQFMKDPRDINKRLFDKKLRELSEVLSPEQISHIEESFEEGLHKFGKKAKLSIKENAKPVEGKYEKSKPKDILKKMDDRSDIRELRQDLADNPKEFDKLAKQKVKSILLEGNVEGIPTGDQLYSILNKTSNKEILNELLGKEAYEAALSAARQLGKNNATKMAMAKIIRKGSLITKLGTVGLLI
jgi:hypothetical protein